MLVKDDKQEPAEPGQDEREVWEPPTLRAVGTIAQLVQVSKLSGSQDCGGRKRARSGKGC